MKRISITTRVMALLALVFASHGPSLMACSVCFGDPESPMSLGLAWGVGALLGVVMLVLGGFTAFFIFLARRARQVAAAARVAGVSAGQA